MKKSEIYSVICKIFALNFAISPSQKLLDDIKVNPKWIFQNQSDENKKANELYANALQNENSQTIASDFNGLKRYFSANFFFENESEILTKFYAKCGFKPNLKTSSIDSVTNEFSFLAAFLELPVSKERNEVIAIFLGVHLLPLMGLLSDVLIREAKSDYYKAFGYFVADFSNDLQTSLNIKAITR